MFLARLIFHVTLRRDDPRRLPGLFTFASTVCNIELSTSRPFVLFAGGALDGLQNRGHAMGSFRRFSYIIEIWPTMVRRSGDFA